PWGSVSCVLLMRRRAPAPASRVLTHGGSGMAGVVKERIRDWMRRRVPSDQDNIRVYECADITDLLEPGDPAYGLANREGMLFTSRDHPAPAPRRELV